MEYQKKTGLFTILIKNHPNGENCSPFIAFIDSNGRHRGSQKIDNADDEETISDHFLENARDSINELEETLRFYHLKVPRRAGRGFEHKVASVKHRTFMSSKFYSCLIDFLSEDEDENTFSLNVSDFSAFAFKQEGFCGNGVCDQGETSFFCPEDCDCADGDTQECGETDEGECEFGTETC